MRKLFFILLACSSFASAASCPLYTYPSPPSPPGLDQDMNNVCHNISYPAINYGTASTMTVTNLNATYLIVSSITSSGNNLLNSAGYIIGTVVKSSQAVDQTSITSSGTGVTSTNTTASITPKSATDKIRISVSGSIENKNITLSNVYCGLLRGATRLDNGSGFVAVYNGNAGTANPTGIGVPASFVYLDSPATTSSVTYTVYIQSSASADGVWNALTGSSTMLLEDIAN